MQLHHGEGRALRQRQGREGLVQRRHGQRLLRPPLPRAARPARHESGCQYPIYCRKIDSPEASEEILLDQNALAEGHGFLSAFIVPSPDHRTIAVVSDTVGRRWYSVAFRDIATGERFGVLLGRSQGADYAGGTELEQCGLDIGGRVGRQLAQVLIQPRQIEQLAPRALWALRVEVGVV